MTADEATLCISIAALVLVSVGTATAVRMFRRQKKLMDSQEEVIRRQAEQAQATDELLKEVEAERLVRALGQEQRVNGHSRAHTDLTAEGEKACGRRRHLSVVPPLSALALAAVAGVREVWSAHPRIAAATAASALLAGTTTVYLGGGWGPRQSETPVPPPRAIETAGRTPEPGVTTDIPSFTPRPSASPTPSSSPSTSPSATPTSVPTETAVPIGPKPSGSLTASPSTTPPAASTPPADTGVDTETVGRTPAAPGSEHAEDEAGRGPHGGEERPGHGRPKTGPEDAEEDDDGLLDGDLLDLPQELLKLVLVL